MPPASNLFLEKLSALPHFDYVQEVQGLIDQHGVSVRLVQEIVDRRYAPKEDVCRLWADSLGVACVDPFASVVTDEALQRIPVEIAKRASALGLYMIDGVLTVALSTPEDPELLKRLAQITQVPISPVFALPREIEDAIVIHYSSDLKLERSLEELEKSRLFTDPDLASEKVAQLAESEAMVQLIDEIIYFGLRERATDVHIEPQENLARIRFRVDGRLREVITYSRKLHRAMISRLKVLAGLNVAEARFPQDGRFTLPIGSTSASFRLATVPTGHGEKAVVRILGVGGRRTMLTLEKMMISRTIAEPFRELIQSPAGIIFVTGPSGSGRTTTLYAALHEVNKPDANVATIEDPVEIQMEGVTQTQVNSHIDLKPGTILRSLLRQDPDVIMLGEIRDLETAKLATEAALTGQIVFATLHTNTAAQAVVRLLELGVEPFMVAPSVIGVLGQRLAARICVNCKEAYQPAPSVLARHFEDADAGEVTFYRGRGCPECRGTGYKGRIAFHEFMPVTEEIRSLITEGRSARDITRAAAKVGHKSLRHDGLKKVLLGLTTIDEIEQNTSFEWAD